MKRILLIFFFLSLIPLANADLGKFSQNQCVPIVAPLNATAVTLTNVNSPSPNSTILLTNKAMTAQGSLFNYSFCNTTKLGVYSYGYCDQAGNCYGNTFTVNPPGQILTQQQVVLICIGLAVIFSISIFFFILGILFRHPGTKLFCMALSALSLIILMGIVTSSAQLYLAEFPTVLSIYEKYYIFIMILSGGAMIGIILWLIYYGFTLFNKTRGRVPDE